MRKGGGKRIEKGSREMIEIETNLNRTLEIDSPFQTFAVGLLIEFID